MSLLLLWSSIVVAVAAIAAVVVDALMLVTIVAGVILVVVVVGGGGGAVVVSHLPHQSHSHEHASLLDCKCSQQPSVELCTSEPPPAVKQIVDID